VLVAPLAASECALRLSRLRRLLLRLRSRVGQNGLRRLRDELRLRLGLLLDGLLLLLLWLRMLGGLLLLLLNHRLLLLSLR